MIGNIAYLLGSLFFLCTGIAYLNKRRYYKSFGIEVVGKVINVLSEGKGEDEVFRPVVKFTTLESVEVEQNAPHTTYPSYFKRGDKITIIYKQEDHGNFIVVTKREVYMAIAFIVIGSLGLIVTLFYSIKGVEMPMSFHFNS